MDKAQELTLNTIILAALGVLILLVSSALIYKYIVKGPGPVLDSCANLQGTCSDVPCEELGRNTYGQKDCEEGQHCCYSPEQNT